MLENFDYTEVLEKLDLSRNFVSDLITRTANNDMIAGYFFELFEETNRDRYLALCDELRNCGKVMQFDRHNRFKIMDLVRLHLCHNRSCPNCQKMIQATRLQRFTPVLLDTSDTCDLYHMVLTVPNIPGVYLRSYVPILFEACKRLFLFLRGHDKIRGVDLSALGFTAALRSFEITFTQKDYHPHLHCIVAVRQGLDLPKRHKNKYSYDYTGGKRVYKRSFSDFELFLQKLWRLLIDQIVARVYKFGDKLTNPLPKSNPLYRVFAAQKARSGRKSAVQPITLAAVQALGDNDGYSVIFDPVDNDSFVQVFKYAFKVSSDDAQARFMTYEQFKTIYLALNGRRTIQGYGAWYNMQADDSIEEEQEEFFDVFKAYLWQMDYPDSVRMSSEDVLALMQEGDFKFISRSKLRLLPTLSDSPLAAARDVLPPIPKQRPSMPDLAGAYFHFMRAKSENALFDSLHRVTDPDNGMSMVVLDAAQLDFLTTIFADV